MRLRHVDPASDADLRTLYELLAERTPEQSISHKRMPTYDEHVAFVRSGPYMAWYLIEHVHVPEETFGVDVIGSIYLTRQREIGVHIAKDWRGGGRGREAVQRLLALHPGKCLANVNPKNKPSRRLWESMGGKLIQETYEL